jgi:hypothetical protein
VVQALVLSGLRRYLYSEIENMLDAADYLGGVVDKDLFTEVGRKGGCPEFRGTSVAAR